MKDYIKELGNIVVELLIKSRENDMDSSLDSAWEESKESPEDDETLKTVRKWMISEVTTGKVYLLHKKFHKNI